MCSTVRHTLALLTVALLLAAPAIAVAQTIVAFGDSTTAPRGTVDIYPPLLQEELTFNGVPLRVVNAGVGGNTTKQAKSRFETDVLNQKPDVVVIQFGINDAAVDVWKTPPATGPRVSLADYEQNLRGFVATLKQRGVRTVLMAPNPLRWTPELTKLYGREPYQPDEAEGLNVLLRDYAEAVRRIAREEAVGLVDVFAAFLEEEKASNGASGKPVRLLLDGMHPNDRGHRLIAELLMARLIAEDHRFARKPLTQWTRSGPDVTLHPLATDITHDTPNPAVLGPALARLPNGAVMSIYSTPTSYGGKPGECFIAGRITRDGGKTWEPEREITRNPECRASHPTAYTARDGTIHVFYLGYKKHAWKDGNPTAETRSDLWTVRSRDGGTTWSERQMIFEGYTGATNGAEESREGHLIVPFSHYVANPGRLVARTVVSADGGKTWKRSNALDIGGAGDHEGALEPAVLQLNDGRIWMLIRTSRGVFWESFSTDGGLTWSEAKPTTIESSHAPGHLVRLADGQIALAWNPRHCNRRQLHLALSADEGRTWSNSLVVARGSAVTYPFVFEHRPGEMWIGFMDTHQGWGTAPRARHVKIAESALLTGGP